MLEIISTKRGGLRGAKRAVGERWGVRRRLSLRLCLIKAELGWLINRGSRVLFNKGVLEFYLIRGFLSSIQTRRAHPASRLARPRARRRPPLLERHAHPAQVKLLLPNFHRNRTRTYYNTALFGGGCWVSLTGRFHRHSAAGWAECTVAGPGRVRRHAAQFSERSSTPLIGHARVALSGVPTRLLSTQTDDTQRGGKGHKLLPAQ